MQRWTVAAMALATLAMAPFPALAQRVDFKKPDWVSPDPPPNPAAVVTIPDFPQVGRKFAIKRSGRGSGSGDTMRVADGNGRLDILDGKRVVQYINLARCFSFSRMNDNHDWGKQGKPQWATSPSDCKVWDGRRWSQTYKTQVPQLRNPCYYQPAFEAHVSGAPGNFVVEVRGNGPALFTDRNEPFQVRTYVKWEETLGFFRTVDVGYVGRIDVLNEIK